MSNVIDFKPRQKPQTQREKLAEMQKSVDESLILLASLCKNFYASTDLRFGSIFTGKNSEKDVLQLMLNILEGDVAKLAELVGLDRFTLKAKLVQFGLLKSKHD